MNKLVCLIGIFFTCGVCSGQNLVPNGSFEQYYSCPDNQGQLDTALSWMNPCTPAGGTPDYFNECSISPFASIPINWSGYQSARTGTAYAGAYIWRQINIREYLETSLVSPLVANACYHLEMYVNLGDSCRYTTDDIGVYFSDTIILGVNNYYPLSFTPQITNASGNNFDTVNWVLVSGNYTAHGGESYLLIGNFKNDSLSNSILINPTGAYGWAYCYIDDVSLTPCTSVNELDGTFANCIFPNPFTDKLVYENKSNQLSEIILYDIISRKLMQQEFINSISLNTEQLTKGIYLYEVRNKNGVIKKGKVVKD